MISARCAQQLSQISLLLSSRTTGWLKCNEALCAALAPCGDTLYACSTHVCSTAPVCALPHNGDVGRQADAVQCTSTKHQRPGHSSIWCCMQIRPYSVARKNASPQGLQPSPASLAHSSQLQQRPFSKKQLQPSPNHAQRSIAQPPHPSPSRSKNKHAAAVDEKARPRQALHSARDDPLGAHGGGGSRSGLSSNRRTLPGSLDVHQLAPDSYRVAETAVLPTRFRNAPDLLTLKALLAQHAAELQSQHLCAAVRCLVNINKARCVEQRIVPARINAAEKHTLDALAVLLQPHLSVLQLRQQANLLWCCARLSYWSSLVLQVVQLLEAQGSRDCGQWDGRIVIEAQPGLSGLSPQGLANIAWSLARAAQQAGHSPVAAQMSQLHAVRIMDAVALATLSHLAALSDGCVDDVTAGDSASMHKAIAAHGSVHERDLRLRTSNFAAEEAAKGKWRSILKGPDQDVEMSSQALSMLAHACGVLLYDGEGLLEALLVEASNRLRLLLPQHLANCMWAAARLHEAEQSLHGKQDNFASVNSGNFKEIGSADSGRDFAAGRHVDEWVRNVADTDSSLRCSDINDMPNSSRNMALQPSAECGRKECADSPNPEGIESVADDSGAYLSTSNSDKESGWTNEEDDSMQFNDAGVLGTAGHSFVMAAAAAVVHDGAMKDAKWQSWNMLAWGFAKFGSPHADLGYKISEAVVQHALYNAPPPAWAAVMWALGSLRHADPRVCQAAEKELVLHMFSYSPQLLTQMLWSLGMLRHRLSCMSQVSAHLLMRCMPQPSSTRMAGSSHHDISANSNNRTRNGGRGGRHSAGSTNTNGNIGGVDGSFRGGEPERADMAAGLHALMDAAFDAAAGDTSGAAATDADRQHAADAAHVSTHATDVRGAFSSGGEDSAHACWGGWVVQESPQLPFADGPTSFGAKLSFHDMCSILWALTATDSLDPGSPLAWAMTQSVVHGHGSDGYLRHRLDVQRQGAVAGTHVQTAGRQASSHMPFTPEGGSVAYRQLLSSCNSLELQQLLQTCDWLLEHVVREES